MSPSSRTTTIEKARQRRQQPRHRHDELRRVKSCVLVGGKHLGRQQQARRLQERDDGNDRCRNLNVRRHPFDGEERREEFAEQNRERGCPRFDVAAP
jgi:hypothetical protein